MTKDVLNAAPLNILHVTHSWGGGIDTYIGDLTSDVAPRHNHFLLKSFGDRLELEYGLGGTREKKIYYLTKTIQLSDFYDKEYEQLVTLILKSFKIQLVHISSTIYHTFDIFKIPPRLNIAVIFTVHDFFHICPTIHLVRKDGHFCGMCRHGEERVGCLTAHPYVYSRFDAGQLKRWRDEFIKIKEHIGLFLFPSRSAQRIFATFYALDASVCRVVGHGMSISATETTPATTERPGIRVAIVGSLLKHKGKTLLKKVLKSVDDPEIDFIQFGDGYINARKVLKRYGQYRRQDILRLLHEHQVDVVMLLSTWPETFSYTLSEAVTAHKPVIVTNFGALKERVEENNLGWVVPDNSPESICRLLRDLKKNKQRIHERSKHLASLPVKSLPEMKAEYGDIYRTAVSKRNVEISVNDYYRLCRYKLENAFGKKRIFGLNLSRRFTSLTWKMAKSISYLIY